MIEYIQTIQHLNLSNTPFALVIVTQTWSSSPRPQGSIMIISKDQKIYGSISGGCVEKDVVVEAMITINQNQIKILNFGVSQETAWNSGLSCGGSIELLIVPSSFLNAEISWNTLLNNQGSILLFPLKQNLNPHLIINPLEASPKSQSLYKERRHGIIDNFFALLLPPKSKLFIIGAVHVAAELVFLANHFDFETHIIDPRTFFSKNTEFKSPPSVISTEWPEKYFKNYQPGPYDYAVFLSHDPKIDDQGIEILLRSDIAYLGALGGKKSNEKRKFRLLEKGFTSEEIEKIKAPVGLKINSNSAKEIALSIMAEIIAVKNMHLV